MTYRGKKASVTSLFEVYHLQAQQRCSGKDQLLFLWERADFALLQSRNYLTNQYQILNDWLHRWDKENCQILLWLVLGDCLPMLVKYIILLFYCFFFLFRWSGYRPQFATEFWCPMAQKTLFGVRMYLLSIRSVKIETLNLTQIETKKNVFINIFILIQCTKNSHWCFISPI